MQSGRRTQVSALCERFVGGRLWGSTPPNDREFDAIEAAFRLELMLSVGAVCFDADTDARNKEKAHERCTGIFPPHVNTFRALSQRRVSLAKQLTLCRLKEDALEEVNANVHVDAVTLLCLSERERESARARASERASE